MTASWFAGRWSRTVTFSCATGLPNALIANMVAKPAFEPTIVVPSAIVATVASSDLSCSNEETSKSTMSTPAESENVALPRTRLFWYTKVLQSSASESYHPAIGRKSLVEASIVTELG